MCEDQHRGGSQSVSQSHLALHPDKVRVASGQTAGVDKDGKPMQACVHIWDSTTLVTLQQIGLGTFQRGVGVGSLAFSIADSGAFLCVIDDSNEHILSVWDCTKGTKHAEIKVNKDSEVEHYFPHEVPDNLTEWPRGRPIVLFLPATPE
ncbi:Echinoderm microtubule-associated protein-like 3 [Ilyodon furcidens]|uniref:Echinoderm microtubule-associated protein-like 3 n=1 Tax=Ilyodon furcidens TaxID=33524 RepID=A0ABV0V4G7_9TELE